MARIPQIKLMPEIQGFRFELQRSKVNSGFCFLSSTLYSSASFAATETNHAQSKLTLNMISLWLPEFQPERGRSCPLLMMYDKVIAARLPKLSPPVSTRRFLQLHSAYIFIRRLNNYPKSYPTATVQPFE
jgi:hypothetical protein